MEEECREERRGSPIPKFNYLIPGKDNTIFKSIVILYVCVEGGGFFTPLHGVSWILHGSKLDFLDLCSM